MKRITYNNYKQIINDLFVGGNAIRLNKIKATNIMLDSALYHIYCNGNKSIQLIIGNEIPSYDLQCIIMNKFGKSIPVIYIAYFIDLQKQKVTFSVRHYPINNVNSPINALKIAEHFCGGGHPNASGFSITLSEFNIMLENNFQAIKNVINHSIK